MDVLTPGQRRLNMSRIRSANTMPEILLRRGLFGRGLRYRINVLSLPGKPDLVFRRFGAVIFVHGCFWHGHANCIRFKPPASDVEYWATKISRNRHRDMQNQASIIARGWRVLTVWECALVGKHRLRFDYVCDECERFLRGSSPQAAIAGHMASDACALDGCG